MRLVTKTTPAAGTDQGFTLIELMIVIAILTVLSAVALSGFAVFKIRAQESLLKNLVYLVKVETDTVVHDYSITSHWGGNYDTAFLNGRLEKTLEAGAPGSIQGVKNPFSGSRSVINWPTVLLAESNPAIQITNNPDYSYAGMGTATVHPELRGSVVVYTDNGVPAVDIYYVDLLGKQSELHFTSAGEGGAVTTATSTTAPAATTPATTPTTTTPSTTTPTTTTPTTTTPTTTTPATTTPATTTPTTTTPTTTTPATTPITTTTAPASPTPALTKEQLQQAQELAREQAKQAQELARELAKQAKEKAQQSQK